MSGRLMRSAEALIGQTDIASAAPRRVGTLVAHEGLMLEVEGFGQPLGSTAKVMSAAHAPVRGEVVGFRGNRSIILPFDGDVPYVAGSRVLPDGDGGLATCGSGLLGRVVDAHGDPLDGRGPITSRFSWPLAGRRGNPLQRGRVTRALDMGVRSINGLLTIGQGQRVAIIAGSGVGKSVLMGQMLAGAECDVMVVGLVGERSREVSDFLETKLTPSMRARTAVVAVPADHPPLLRLRAAMRATAIAEYFRNEGKNVFLLIDSLTRVAHAQREIGLSLGEPPTMKGYPPSALGIIPRLVERAGADRVTGGSITAIYTVLADGGDNDDPVVDAARAIVDGHIVLSRSLSEQGIYPAIDVSRSLSRTMVDVIDPDHAAAAAHFRQLWSLYEENRDLLLMGAYAPGNDAALDEAISRRTDMLGFLRQGALETVSFDRSRADLITGFGA
ncbi:MAG: FliI/YscN family ATPase [Sphingomonadaceae bacterium]|nr:FliI/YscN family ATPase [Sphingomonadaceae bacterium]